MYRRFQNRRTVRVEFADKGLLEKINAEKNVLFTKKSVRLRKKNGFWLPKEE